MNWTIDTESWNSILAYSLGILIDWNAIQPVTMTMFSQYRKL